MSVFKFTVTRWQQLYTKILEDAISRTHLPKDFWHFFSKIRSSLRKVHNEKGKRAEAKGGSVQALRRSRYLVTGRLRRGWRIKASKGRWGDAARKGGGMEEPSLEALMQAILIFVVAIAIIFSNLLIIVSYLNFRGKPLHPYAIYIYFNVIFIMLS